MNNTDQFLKSLQVAESYRDESWEKSFLEEILNSYVTISQKDVQQGPDNYPYLYLEIKKDSTESFLDVLNWTHEKAVGIAINPHKQLPDYIFTYGMIWGFKHMGSFFTENTGEVSQNITFKEGDKFYIKKEIEEVIPKDVRINLRSFLKQQEVLSPKILLLGKDKKDFDICFSLESLGEPESKEHSGILQALSWFFPNQYKLALISEKLFPQFQDL